MLPEPCGPDGLSPVQEGDHQGCQSLRLGRNTRLHKVQSLIYCWSGDLVRSHLKVLDILAISLFEALPSFSLGTSCSGEDKHHDGSGVCKQSRWFTFASVTHAVGYTCCWLKAPCSHMHAI